MFYRKISKKIEEYFDTDPTRILCIDGARQVGKSFIIREIGKKRFKNFIELNMADDYNGDRIFENARTIETFYVQLSINNGSKLGRRVDTLIFIDEIQVYPHLLTLLKPLLKDNRYRYICSGSELGMAMAKTTLIPMGSIAEEKMYPMDFEEFLLANSFGEYAFNHLRSRFEERMSLDEATHRKMLSLFKTYLYVGGMPDAVKAYVETKNVVTIKEVQSQIVAYYGEDASKYDKERKLSIKRLYDLIPSNLENKVKRIKVKDIGGEGARFGQFEREFEYLSASMIALEAKAVSEPKFPLIQSSSKNLTKLYMNDVGLLSFALYKNNVNAILQDRKGVNLGSVYETAVAQELKAHGHELYYFDRKKVGEVDFLIDDYEDLSICPIEVKSGSDERNFRALPKIIQNQNYKVSNAYVLSNKDLVIQEGKITYMPIYFIPFI